MALDAGAAPTVTVLVAETGLKRERSAQELIALMWPMVALLLAAGLSILLAVRGAVRPLQLIASRWSERSQVSLQPISDDDVPRELLPFTAALNDLLARIRGLLARERQFAAIAAHQLRTPLAGLQLGLSRAAKAADIDQARQVIGELSQATERTARIVQQLLALGRIDPEHRVTWTSPSAISLPWPKTSARRTRIRRCPRRRPGTGGARPAGAGARRP